ncbi:MAG TPA: hypothetical protein DCF63_05205, partial [Planctomycetaceae bacterium]|nr:hypothetical protein [Planctomycetaceae bacterium]
ACFGSGINNPTDSADDGEMDTRSDGIFSSLQWRKISDVTDGTSNTMAVSESLLGPGNADLPASGTAQAKLYMALIAPAASVTSAN